LIAPVLENVTVPVLALNGEKDLQVPPKENLAEIEKALKTGGKQKRQNFDASKSESFVPDSQNRIANRVWNDEETFSPDALKIMKDWIIEVTK